MPRPFIALRVSDVKTVNKVIISIMSAITQTKPTKHMEPLCF